MKRWVLLIIGLILFGCQKTKTYTLHYFYNETCPECQLMSEDFFESLDDQIIVVYHNMDQEESIQKYKECLEHLENIDEGLYQQQFTPFIYMENGFAAIGYTKDMKSVYLTLINETIENKPYSIIPSGVWVSQGGK